MGDLLRELAVKQQSSEAKQAKADLWAEVLEKEKIERDKLPEIASAPELNSLSDAWGPQLKTAFGIMAANDSDALKIIQEQLPDAKVKYKYGTNVISLKSGDYVLNKEGLSPTDVTSFIFDALSFLPAGRANTVLGAVGANAATQAGIDTATGAIGGDGPNIKDVALAGAVGGGFKAAENIIGTGYRASRGTIDDASQEVINAGSRAEVDVLKSDLIPPETFLGKNLSQTAEKVPFVGTAEMRQAQQIQRVDATQQVANRFGEFSYDDIVKSLKAKKDRTKKAAGNTLERVASKLDPIGEIPLDNTLKSMDSAMNLLNKKEVLKDNSAINDLLELADVITGSPQTFTSLKENRTAFRELVDKVDTAQRSQLGSRAKGLLSKVLTSMGDDMDALAKSKLTANEYRQWKNANATYASEARSLTKTKLKTLLDKGDVAPEAVESMLFSRKPSELRLLYKSLTNEGRANARSAIIGKIAAKALSKSEDINPNIFATEMGRNALPIDVFFKGQDKKALKGFERLLNATRRAQDASLATPTGQSLFTIAGAGGMSIAPVESLIVAGALGLSSRAFESRASRNALIRLGSLQPRSTRFEKALLEAQTVLNASAQAAIDQENAKEE